MKTHAERVYRRLRADILAGRKGPGEKLPLAVLATEYQASMGVVREALLRLAGEGLAVAEPQIGFRVVPISMADLVHLTEARCAIEGLVFEQAVQFGDLEWESALIAAHHRLERTPQMDGKDADRVAEDWASAHAHFHSTLLSGCPNPRLRATALSLRDAAELYRRWSVPLGGNHRDIVSEHRGLRDAALARDKELAVRLLVEHIETTTRLLRSSQDGNSGPAAGTTNRSNHTHQAAPGRSTAKGAGQARSRVSKSH